MLVFVWLDMFKSTHFQVHSAIEATVHARNVCTLLIVAMTGCAFLL